MMSLLLLAISKQMKPFWIIMIKINFSFLNQNIIKKDLLQVLVITINLAIHYVIHKLGEYFVFLEKDSVSYTS